MQVNESLKKPLPNSYWVRPKQLLAGEYPLVSNDEESAIRLQDLLLAGVTCFVDLTAEHELPAYGARLPEIFGGRTIRHQRFTLTDHGIPDSIQQMSVILDAIDAEIHADGCVYVHCRAGIGRTGTVIGCHLVRHGHDSLEAVEALNRLWQECERSKRWSHVPETDEQEVFILEYKDEQARSTLPVRDDPRLGAYQGALLGLMLGDVLGDMRASAADGQTISNLSGAAWSGSAAMTWALADSLLHCRQQTPADQMQRYLACQKRGEYTAQTVAVALPEMAQKALGLWQGKRNPLAGSHDPALIDAHPLVRCAPVALFFSATPEVALNEAAESARTTAQAPMVLDACRVFAALLLSLLEGVSAPKAVQFNTGKAAGTLRRLKLKPELENLINGGWRIALTQPAVDDCLSVLASACHALATTSNFRDAVFKAMHMSARPAVVGAVCGALAGALYGVQGLPIVWRETLPKAEELLKLSERLLFEAPDARA